VPASHAARLADILDAIDGIQTATADVEFANYVASWEKRRAVERGIEIISEASRHIPDELKASFPAIPWRDIASIGNLLRHAYHHVDDRIIWNVVKEHLPPLRRAVEDMMA
jgi:uncharacterized protein with HEPN domain